jgi:uncharacterized membrane protein YphA (DoxX/SURF4 family)
MVTPQVMQQRIILGARVLLGLVFFIVGVIGLLNLAQIPTRTATAANFLAAMQATSYLYRVVNGIEFICGAALMLGVFVPFALVLLAPVLANIMLYTLFLDPVGLPVAAAVLLIDLFVVWCYRAAFISLFQMKPTPLL